MVNSISNTVFSYLLKEEDSTVNPGTLLEFMMLDLKNTHRKNPLELGIHETWCFNFKWFEMASKYLSTAVDTMHEKARYNWHFLEILAKSMSALSSV